MEFSDESVKSEREAAAILGKAVLVGVPRIRSRQEQRKLRLRLTGAFVGTSASAGVLAYVISKLTIGS
jgi:hypothetical protein